MDIEDMILKWGLTSQTQNIVVALDGTPSQKLGGQLQTDAGLIYGFNIWCDTVDPQGNPLITTTDATNLYLNLKIGATDRIEVLRLDDLLSVYAGAPVGRYGTYKKLIVPWYTISLDKSTIENPTAITGTPPPEVWINMYYINMDDYLYLMKCGPDYGIASRYTTKGIRKSVEDELTANGEVMPQLPIGAKQK